MGSIASPPPIRLAIFECDTPLDDARARYGTYGGMFEALFLRDPKKPQMSDRFAVTKWKVDQNDADYPEADAIDVILITGSSKGSFLPSESSVSRVWIQALISSA